ncbi:hypothetical protein [Paenibacillus antarcticus]|uniref:CD-NTase associated protein 4-like DNA endonuclease domain-containing protein n=1 Tax=Paenibacillus antarcticus TaxID=253703 RepID=A0A168QB58_9BACL|nr:hypothetical protein [Paenibacillus antarcticus]OAB47587.1 hypothetical protein PBAT_05025 [Paenibacillus antarcticus]
MTDQIINRESGNKTKGFRLQRLRACQLILEKMKFSDKIAVFAATEYLDDVYTKTVQINGEISEYSEGDKDYASKKSFSYNANEVKNSLVIFLDCWFSNKLSSHLQFGFYTNIKCGSENNTEALKKLKVELPAKSIIEMLMNRDFTDSKLLPAAKAILINEYKEQYEDRKEPGFLDSIEQWDDTIWIDFFNRIDWKFEQEDDKLLEKTVLREIRDSKFYNHKLEGREGYVLSALLEEFERKENVTDFLARLVSASDVRVKFLEVATHNYKRNDPIYEEWEKLAPPIDKRNIDAKIVAVCGSYNKKKLGIFARKIGAVKVELSKIDSKDRGSYQFRIFESCESLLLDLLDSHRGKDITTYVLSNRDTLKNAILDLFDSCYLAFDEGGQNA